MTAPAHAYLELEPDPVVVFQAFPVEVLSSPVGPILQARVTVTQLAVYLHTSPGEAAYAGLLDQAWPAGPFQVPSAFDGTRVWFAAVDQGSDDSQGAVTWQAGRGCGCSSPLKGFRPFTPMRLGAR